MRKALGTLRKYWRSERGITGLETAIILIAFIVVASVFSYTVLGAGIFASQKGKDAINAGMNAADSSMTLVGDVIASENGSTGYVGSVTFDVADAVDGGSVDWTPAPNNVVTINYVDAQQHTSNVPWTETQIGRGNGDYILNPGEKFEITVDLTGLTTPIGTDTNFTVEVLQPGGGSSLPINRKTPAYIDPVMDLY